MKSRREMAMDYFGQGYNCAQSLMLAFEDCFPLEDREALIRLSSAFGGGMGRLREVCGAVSGMFMVTGLLKGYAGPETGEAKTSLYEEVQKLAGEFEKANGSIVCRELLSLKVRHDIPVPEARTESYYKKRPCKELVGMAAEILEARIKEWDK